jgi:hypothetical protein
LEAVILAIHALDEAEKGGAPPAKLQRLRVVAERAAGRLPDDTKRALAALGA